MSEMISFAGNGEMFEGYLATSITGKGPGIVVIQEYWGLVDHIKRVADRLSQAGYTALAPDFYHGKATKDPDEASSLMMALNIADAEMVLRGAVDYLLEHDAVKGDKVGVVGFCMGGQLSLYAATVNHKIGACVDFYGIHPNVKPHFENLEAPVLGFFASEDNHTGPGVVADLDEKLNRLGKPHDFHMYEGKHHAFFNDDRPEVYDKEAAHDAWNKMTSFFDANLM